MSSTLLSVLAFTLGVLAIQNVDSTIHRRETPVNGDSKCTDALCISGVVNGSTVQYVLQSTGTYKLGWMAMGFGSTMANTPMVIMWPNPDGNITLSQRQASGEIMPRVVSSPPRIATLLTSLSSTSGTQPTLAYSIPANSDTQQNLIWAFGTIPPSSSAVDAVLQQHATSGTLSLDLTKTIEDPSTADDPANNPQSSESPSSSTATTIPLSPSQKLCVAHGILCTLGFLFFLPAGALLARYLRTFNSSWFQGHWFIQFAISGPIIIAGVACAIRAIDVLQAGHLDDVHKKWGVAIFTLYFAQCALGAFIHFVKPKSWTRRPPQNYLHAIFGLLIISLAFYQVRSGFIHEWPYASGRGALPKGVNILWYVWVVLLPVLYAIGLALLPRQYSQERQSRALRSNDISQNESRK